MDNPTHAHPSSTALAEAGKETDTASADLVIRRTTVATVLFLAAVAAIVSYGHMHELALRHGEEPWIAALVPLSVDGMIVAASMTLLSDSRHGRHGGILPWTLLIVASGASLAANVADARPELISRVISAWPPFALIGAYEMLIRQIRNSVAHRPQLRSVPGDASDARHVVQTSNDTVLAATETKATSRHLAVAAADQRQSAADHRQRQAWQWAQHHRLPTGELPTGEAIANAFQRSARWGRLVKNAGLSGRFDRTHGQQVA